MERLTVFLVDDEQRALDTLAKTLTTFFPEVDIVGTARTIDDACRGIQEHRPHLVLLDVEMGNENGFQLLERFSDIGFHVAFVTAHEEFALRAIKVSAIDYIIKPADIHELKTLLQKVGNLPRASSDDAKVKHLFGNFNEADRNEHRISVAVAEGYHFIRIGDIRALTAEGSYTTLALRDGTTLLASRNLKSFEGILDGYGFYRIHNSTVVNLRWIKRISRTAGGLVVMDDGTEFSIAKGRKDEFLQLLAIR